MHTIRHKTVILLKNFVNYSTTFFIQRFFTFFICLNKKIVFFLTFLYLGSTFFTSMRQTERQRHRQRETERNKERRRQRVRETQRERWRETATKSFPFWR